MEIYKEQAAHFERVKTQEEEGGRGEEGKKKQGIGRLKKGASKMFRTLSPGKGNEE